MPTSPDHSLVGALLANDRAGVLAVAQYLLEAPRGVLHARDGPPVFLLAAASQWALGALPLEDWVRSGLESLASTGFNLRINDPGKHLWAPITEELWKVTPLLIFIWWRRTGLRSLAGPIDYAVLAGATGAGMAFSEDILVFLHLGLDGPPSSSFALGLGQFYRELIGADPGLFILEGRSDFADNMSFFFPEMQEQNGVVWSGHGALARGLGLSIGRAVWVVRRRQNRLFYLIPVVVYFWVVWEHLKTNWYGGGRLASPRTRHFARWPTSIFGAAYSHWPFLRHLSTPLTCRGRRLSPFEKRIRRSVLAAPRSTGLHTGRRDGAVRLPFSATNLTSGGGDGKRRMESRIFVMDARCGNIRSWHCSHAGPRRFCSVSGSPVNLPPSSPMTQRT